MSEKMEKITDARLFLEALCDESNHLRCTERLMIGGASTELGPPIRHAACTNRILDAIL
jgi:hypothetical protein